MKIVCFIASVIKDERRLRYFRHLLDSIREQTTAPTNIYISIHIAFEFSETEWKKLFAKLPGNPVILRQKQPKKQFVQYRELLKRADDDLRKKETFIMFSDDDDLWHPMRVQRYMEWYEKATLLYPSIVPCLASIQVREQTTCGLPCLECQRVNERNVDAMLQCGCVKIDSFPVEEGPMYLEYHQYVVRPHVMQEFIDANPKLVETNRFTDMEFRQFVRHYGKDAWKTGQLVTPHWMYYYRCCDSTYDAVTRHFKPDEFDKYVEYLTEMAECPAMGPEAAKKCITSCDSHLWPVLFSRVKGL